MAHQRSYTDLELATAIQESTSWRGTLRALGLAGTSAGAIRSARARADHLALDYQHFTGQRRWSNAQLRAAIETSSSWSEVAAALHLRGSLATRHLKGHAARLNFDTRHLEKKTPETPARAELPDLTYLPRAGSLLAAAWFTLCGTDVSWPLEPCRYDLLICKKDQLQRIQVKTTRVRKSGTWIVYLSTSRRGRQTYDPDEIDAFFVIDGELNYYLIPMSRVGGLQAIHLREYADCRLPQLRFVP